MKEKFKTLLIILLYIVTVVFGIFSLVTWDKSLYLVRIGSLITIAVIIGVQIILRIIIQRQWTLYSLFQLLSYIVLFIMIDFYFTPFTAMFLITIGGGLWLIIDGVIKCFYGYQRIGHHRLLGFGYILFGLFNFLFANVLLHFDNQAFNLLRIFLGVYFIVFGSFHLLDMIFRRPYFIRFLIRIKILEFTPRTLFSIYSPRTFRLHFDELAESEKANFKEAYKIVKDNVEKKVEIHVYVHMKYPVADMFGHVDFAIDGINYTYGNYDESTLKWMNNRSEGVLIVAPNEKYLEVSVQKFRKIIADFTLNITETQKQALLTTIRRVVEQEAHAWDPDTIAKKVSYSKIIKAATVAKFYKFNRESEHVNYITATSNCVNFFDDIISEAGIKIFPNQTISTPGDIFNILNTYAEDENDTLVVRRKLLTRADFIK